MTEDQRRLFRLDETRRIKLENDFKRVYQFRARRFNSLVAVCCAPREPGEPSRLGVSVSKKKVKKAVLRNRWKRLIREAFRRQYYELPESFDFIVIPQRQTPFPTYEEVAQALLELTRSAARKATRIVQSRAIAGAEHNDALVPLDADHRNRDSS